MERGFREAQALRLDPRSRDLVCDDNDHQQWASRSAATDDLLYLPEADVDGVGTRSVPGLQDLRPDGPTRLGDHGLGVRVVRRRRLRADAAERVMPGEPAARLAIG